MSVLDETRHFDIGLQRAAHAPGKVTLVGAGPGDPDLLTVKAARALQSARLVLHDQLVSAEVMALLPPGAECISVGKAAGQHSMPQTAITALMLRLAQSGRPLLRLKGGDPYIFGRGGEEAQALAEAGIPFEVIPGISAAQGAAALAGMPLTHRDHACSLVLTTGHLRGETDERGLDLDWDLLARPHQTVAVGHGLDALHFDVECLHAASVAQAPAGAVQSWATLRASCSPPPCSPEPSSRWPPASPRRPRCAG